MASSLSALLNRRPNTPFYYGWLVLGLSGAGAFVATAVAGVVLGGVQGYILEDTNWPRTSIGLASSCGVWMSGVFAPFAGRLADRYGPRWLMPIGVIVLGLSMVAIGGVHAAWQFFLAAVIGRAISQPFLIGVVPRTMAVNFFDRRRNLALAITGVYRPVSGGADHPGVFHNHRVGELADGLPADGIFQPVPGRPNDDRHASAARGHRAAARRRPGIVRNSTIRLRSNGTGRARGATPDGGRRGELDRQRGNAVQGLLDGFNGRFSQRDGQFRPGVQPGALPARVCGVDHSAGGGGAER